MKTHLVRPLRSILIIVLFLSGSARLAMAQEGQPFKAPAPPSIDAQRAPGPRQDQNGSWYMPAGSPMSSGLRSQSEPAGTGGPDAFGYTWDDAVPLAWIDARGGANLSNPINLGFSFKFYENTYREIYISENGYACFSSSDLYGGCSGFPSPSSPNNLIAPNWVPLFRGNGYIRYLTGGAAPNRYLVVEWNRVRDPYGMSEYTFEAILHENGDIVFQYQTMAQSGSRCQSSGIEDSQGMDGLEITSFCSRIAPNHAVRITRPAPAASVGIHPLYQGTFTRPGAAVTFAVAIRNTGDLGPDTFDLTTSSGWPMSLCAADGTTPLTDTDGDGTIDGGAVSPGYAANIVAKVQAPAEGHVGDANAATITARSSLDTSQSKTVTLQLAIPAAFAQVYRDASDGAPSLYLAQPGGQKVKRATHSNPSDWESAVAEAPNGNFVYVWSTGRCLDKRCDVFVTETGCTLLDKYGDIVREVSKLANHSGGALSTYDQAQAVAVGPDGRIGIVWVRRLDDVVNSSWLVNYNVFLAILDASGNVAYGPLNLTSNSDWGTADTPDVLQFDSPRITATGDNRFVLAWHRQQPVSNCSSNDCTTNDIYYAVRDTAGNEVRGTTQFTHDTTGAAWESNYSPGLTALRGNRALLTWTRNSDHDIHYAVLDSAGSVVRDQANLVGDGESFHDSGADAVQLPDGGIVVAWSATSQIRFAVLDANYNRSAGPTTLSNPAATTGDGPVSVAADNANHAILTWAVSGRYLYYALVNGNGSLLTPPMIFRSAQGDAPHLDSSHTGYGNTSYSSSIVTGVDNAIWPSGSLAGGAPGGAAVIGVKYANHGQTRATGLVVTATWGSELTYLRDTSAVTPTMAGNSITWNLPDIAFLDERQFGLYVGVPTAAAVGTRYPVTLTVSANEPDANVTDNTAALEVMAALQVYLPVVTR